MPKTSKKLKKSSSSADQDLTQATIAQLARLMAEVLRLHLASHHLVTTGTKAAMAQRLYDAIQAPQDSSMELQQQNPNPSSTSQQQDGVPASHQRPMLQQQGTHPVPQQQGTPTSQQSLLPQQVISSSSTTAA